MDTKGRESAFLAARICELGCKVLVMDVGILGEAEDIQCDITRQAVAEAAGTTIDSLRNVGSRGKAVEGMARGAKVLARALVDGRRIHGAISLGGAEGAVLAAAAMQQMPLGMPKMIVSPIASGQRTFGPFVGTADISVMHSVVDILGLNRVARPIYHNAAAGVSGAALAYEQTLATHETESKRRQIAATMLGNTTRPLMRIRRTFESECGDLVIFHANGVGGAALEEHVDAGHIDGVIDYTLSEIIGHIAGGFHDAGPVSYTHLDVYKRQVHRLDKDPVYRDTAELGYWLAEPYWGRGLMTEAVRAVTRYAFDELGLFRIEAGVFGWNVSSVRVLEKVGYSFEGRLRKQVFKDGQRVDVLLYSRLRTDEVE